MSEHQLRRCDRVPLAVKLGIVVKVDRDPCPRCGCNPERADCGHNRGRLLVKF